MEGLLTPPLLAVAKCWSYLPSGPMQKVGLASVGEAVAKSWDDLRGPVTVSTPSRGDGGPVHSATPTAIPTFC